MFESQTPVFHKSLDLRCRFDKVRLYFHYNVVTVLIGSMEWRTARYVIDIRNRAHVNTERRLTDMPCLKIPKNYTKTISSCLVAVQTLASMA